jgi:hypothetical protein
VLAGLSGLVGTVVEPLTRTDNWAEALPQYAWKYSINKGYHLVFVSVYGQKWHYHPFWYSKPDEVKRDIGTLFRIFTDLSRYRDDIIMDFGYMTFGYEEGIV